MNERQLRARWATLAPIAAVLGCSPTARTQVQSPATEVEHHQATVTPDDAPASEDEDESGCPPGSVHIDGCCGFVPGCCGPEE
ncbi:MAG: hypothetical protein AAF721_05805 [Myxococcota bacterium]